MKPDTLRVDRTDAIGRILLDRPEKRNAISPTMADELARALDTFAADPEIRVVLLRGAGGNFCSGGDLAPDGDAAPQAGSPAATTLAVMNGAYARAIQRLHRLPKPVVALLEGVAAGAGANLALACDLVYASPEARLGELFVKRGLGLDCGGSWLLPRLVGLQKAKEIAFFGDWLSAEEACGLGLVTAIHPADRLEAEVEEKLRVLAARPPIALGQIKQSLHRATTVTMEEALEIEAVTQAACSSTQDFQEGLAAFLEKREPRFEGR